ncbi:MAG: fibronectin type III domain-containing protein [Sphingobacteriales bacterium]|nr:MAG: fibronectin type III domain-containing protein [Sphingobacteriales bacterium]
MKTPKINLSFYAYSDADFENKVAHILNSMTGNPAFPAPIPALADVQAALDKYREDLIAAATLDRVAIAKKNQSRAELELLTKQLGMYVMFIAREDVAILTSSGFTLSKQPEPRYITNPGNVTLSNGLSSGELVASVEAVPGAKSYVYQIVATEPTDTTMWESITVTRSKYTFNGLLPGKRYWVRVAAAGRDEQIAYSPVASQYVQ